MILGTMSVLAIALFWILPALAPLFNHSELAQRETVIVLALGKGLAPAGGLQVVHSVCSRQGTNINQGLLMMFSVLPLAPESIFVRYFVNIRTTSHHEWIVTGAVLSFISSGLIGASVAGAKLYVIRRRKMGAR